MMNQGKAEVAMLLFWAISIFLAVVTTLNAIRRLWRFKGEDNYFCPRKVTIIKPLKGDMDGLRENLESFFLLSYDWYLLTLSFCVDDPSDPAAEIVRDLLRKHPKVLAELLTTPTRIGSNPKISNIYNAYQNADEHIIISDAGARVEKDYVQKMLGQLTSDVGIVTGLVTASGQTSFAGEIEAVYLGTFFARARIFADSIGFPTVMGMSMLFRKSDVEKLGGLGAFAHYLAEDFMMGKRMKELGLKIALVVEPVRQNLGRYTFRTYFNRHLRWGRLRKAHSPVAFCLEPLTYPVVSGLIGAQAFGSAWFLVAHLAFFASLDAVLYKRISGCSINRRTLPAWLFRELTAFPFWVYAFCGNSIDWKGNKLRLRMGGKIEQVSGVRSEE